jgi:hypothetical protein
MTGGNVAATGTWYYDGSVPRRIEVYKKEARLAWSRFDHETDYEPSIDESRPIPATKDGYLYYSSLGNSGEHLSAEDVKAWADSQPWGPVEWD